ncbi:hypothetical protein DFP72DRAFT_1174454 [Ephemerocybe angulata]|uniref:Uncharacterized protein n=1 Tax=Ephemerocybe angulata TaxID=980116 RepID=A0A8H6LY03_9AGAR|nr:hypothetical protein DFP72DRAFT_1174454 [Tulosesus angulatus]
MHPPSRILLHIAAYLTMATAKDRLHISLSSLLPSSSSSSRTVIIGATVQAPLLTQSSEARQPIPGVLSKQPTQAPFIQASNITEGITDSEPTKFLTRDSKFSDCTFNWATSSIPTRGLETRDIGHTYRSSTCVAVSISPVYQPFYLDRNRAKTIHDINIIATSIVCKQRNGNITTLEPREPRQHARHVGYERRSRAAGGRDGDRQRRRGRRDTGSEPLEGEEEEDDEEEEEEEEEEEDDDEDDESSDSENEDQARERSTESKPNSRTTPTASSITINGAESSTQVPVTKPESPPAVAPTSPLSSPPPSVPGSSILQQAIAQAAAAAAVPLDASQVSSTGTVKPKSKATKPRKHRTPSPSPPPVAPPPPLRTVRLEITLGGPSNYEVDVRNLSKETGQRDATPPPPAPPPESEDEEAAKACEEEEEVPEGGAKKKKRKKKSVAQEYYDTNDPFIDDSGELLISAATSCGCAQRTNFQQFFIGRPVVLPGFISVVLGPPARLERRSTRTLRLSFRPEEEIYQFRQGCLQGPLRQQPSVAQVLSENGDTVEDRGMGLTERFSGSSKSYFQTSGVLPSNSHTPHTAAIATTSTSVPPTSSLQVTVTGHRERITPVSPVLRSQMNPVFRKLKNAIFDFRRLSKPQFAPSPPSRCTRPCPVNHDVPTAADKTPSEATSHLPSPVRSTFPTAWTSGLTSISGAWITNERRFPDARKIAISDPGSTSG